MGRAERVALSSIKSLTFYADEQTRTRRSGGQVIPQLTCIGDSCKLYQPEVVECVNRGGQGVDVNWKCEADLPALLRFGRVTVSCEGWSGPGDPYVYKDSCALEYRLVRIPREYEDGYEGLPTSAFTRRLRRWFYPMDLFTALFNLVYIAVLLFFAYRIIRSCFTHPRAPGRTTRGSPPGHSSGGGTSGGNWWRPDHDDSGSPPPPYTPKNDPNPSSASGGWTPGFWTGLGLGGLAASFFRPNNNQRYVETPLQRLQREQAYDWERERLGGGGTFGRSQSSVFGRGTTQRRTSPTENCSPGAGPSGLGTSRRSVGLGGSNVR